MADTPLLAFITDVSGDSVYQLECHNGNYDHSPGYDYSGDLQCALFALERGRRTSWNLLAVADSNERSTDWWNRGRMLADQLRPRGPCTGYPEYGATRHFRLRNMLLTLAFTDPSWVPVSRDGEPRLAGFTFSVSAVPDAKALGETAQRPEGARPPRACYPD